MFLNSLTLQNFRNYTRATFAFDKTSIVIGKNTVGKTNLLEAIRILSNGTSFRATHDIDVIKIGSDFVRIEGKVIDEDEMTTLAVTIAKKNHLFSKKYLVNNIPKRQIDFVSKLLTVLFSPTDIEIITDSPSLRRNYMNQILLQADRAYRLSSSFYEKALKNRNKMLFAIREGKRIPKHEEFEYWDNLLIEHGSVITQARENLVAFFNTHAKELFDFTVSYDKSTVTRERLDHYFEIEQKTGITLIGPQRDEFFFFFPKTERHIRDFGSRGEQRLTMLQMKFLEIEFIKKTVGKNPILLLDDIFSELDNEHIEQVLKFINLCQTIVTTTHKEFIPKKIAKSVKMIELE